MRWGKSHEDNARLAYLQFLQETDSSADVSVSGLVVDISDICLACSLDGLVHLPGNTERNGVVELKCPYTAAQKGLTLLEAGQSVKTFPCKVTEEGSLRLNCGHNQVQGVLAITRRRWCDFVIWTPKGMSVERVHFDAEFWENIKPKLLRFHREALLPELALPRYTSGQAIREPFRQ